MSGVNNGDLFAIAGIGNFPGNKSCYKAVTSCQSKDVTTLFQHFLKKSWTESCQKVELNFRKLVTTVACRYFVWVLSLGYFLFYLQV